MAMPVDSREVTLRDGTRIKIRPIRPDDDHALVDAFHHMSAETVYQRFFAALPELSDDMAWHLSHVNYTNRMALVAEIAEDGPSGAPAGAAPGGKAGTADGLIGIARYERTEEPGVVELGLVVLDPWQNRGLGRILLRDLFDAARRNGINRFQAEVLSDNRRMIHLLASEANVVFTKSRSGITTMLLEPREQLGS